MLADAAVSGTLDCRRGSTIAKALVERGEESGVAWFLIDDLSRMSRSTIESLQLGELARATGVRVVGASDGFDSANPRSALLLPVLSSMNEAIVTQLKAKVKRGMDDAFRRGDNRPICGGCGKPMILGRSCDEYQSFFCFNALHGIEGCTNRGDAPVHWAGDGKHQAARRRLRQDGWPRTATTISLWRRFWRRVDLGPAA